MKCSKCNAELPEVAKFCLMCGTKVIRERICKKCGHKLEDHARFCMMCGTSADVEVDKKDPNVGDVISYGKRSWIVLDVKEDKALLLTQGIVAKMPYDKDGFKKINWKESSLFHWINEDFMNKEFGEIEFSKICANENEEKLFLLSVDDAEKYNKILPILSVDEKYGCDNWWWIQTDVEPATYVPFVRPHENRVDTYGNGIAIHTEISVRLAMWIRL